jgi:hypothetical protein
VQGEEKEQGEASSDGDALERFYSVQERSRTGTDVEEPKPNRTVSYALDSEFPVNKLSKKSLE